MSEKVKKNYHQLRGWLITAIITVIIGGGAFIFYKRYNIDSFTDTDVTMYIRPETSYQEMLDTLSTKIDATRFNRLKRLADFDNYDLKMKPGAYTFTPDMSAVDVYNVLLKGLQTPVKFSFNNIRLPEQFAAKAAKQLMLDSAQIMEVFADSSFVSNMGFTPESFMAVLLPDTYQYYWTVSPKELFSKLKKEYDKYWTSDRKQKAADLGVTPQELAIIASIAEEETNNKQERGVVGRLYLNRVNQGIPLQADPTVKFALKDFGIRRILNEHLKYDSPYNTYRNKGLPPGPIRVPTKQTMDSILNSEAHDFIFMVAKEDFSGTHNFATSYAEHQRNAQRYRKALDRRNIKR